MKKETYTDGKLIIWLNSKKILNTPISHKGMPSPARATHLESNQPFNLNYAASEGLHPR